jgi:hypothetical protein
MTSINILMAALSILTLSAEAKAASVSEVNVNVREVYVRTFEGDVIPLSDSAQSLDLLNMSSTDAVQLTLPGETGSTQVIVTDVILKIKNGQNEVVLDDGSVCKLKPGTKELVLVGASPLILDVGVPYLVHATFGALNLSENNGGHLKCSLAGNQYEISGVEFDESAE